MEKEITVITPTFNRADKLERLYKSLENQSFKKFIWLIMDDGSTDDTRQVVEKLISRDVVKIEYHYHKNVHKVITLHCAFSKVKTPFLIRVDSDDYLPKNSLKVLYEEMLKVKDNSDISSVVGRVKYSNSDVLGDEFPTNPFDEFVFLMKYKYKIRGVHIGLFKTSAIRVSSFDKKEYLGKGYLTDFWNIEIDSKFKTRFINDIIYTYDLNDQDVNSITNTKFDVKNAFGLSEHYRYFIKYYLPLYIYKYPIPIFKNMFKYIYYSSYKNDTGIYKNLIALKELRAQALYVLLYPLVMIFKGFSKDLKKI